MFHPCRIIRTEIGWEIARWCCYLSEASLPSLVKKTGQVQKIFVSWPAACRPLRLRDPAGCPLQWVKMAEVSVLQKVVIWKRSTKKICRRGHGTEEWLHRILHRKWKTIQFGRNCWKVGISSQGWKSLRINYSRAHSSRMGAWKPAISSFENVTKQASVRSPHSNGHEFRWSEVSKWRHIPELGRAVSKG